MVDPAAGTTVIATIREAKRQNTIVRDIGVIRSLTIPVVYTIGRNTQAVVRVDATMAPATCLVPCTAALGAAIPLLRSR